MNWPRRISVAFFGIIAAGMTVIGAGELGSGYLQYGLTCLGVAAAAVVTCWLTWINWRILELNRDLIEENRRLRSGRNAEFTQGWRMPQPGTGEHDEPGEKG